MYRILPIAKDTYITNKIVAGERCETSNVGQAGTLDLYKLYDETFLPGITSSIVEMSRLLVKVDYTPLADVDYTNPTFGCFLNLKDVYGGQTTPSNFTVELWPLSKSFDEGRGSDVVALRDLDTANWLSASSTEAWTSAGAGTSGSLGDTCDILVGTGLGARVFFERGDEDMSVDVTEHVSASLAGWVENHGFRIALSSSLEDDSNTYFVKRFGSRQAYDTNKQPRLIVKLDDQLQDSNGDPQLNVSQSLFVYNPTTGVNFFSGSTELTGVNCMTLVLEASQSYTFITSSWSISHSASINHLTKSTATWSTSFPVHQVFAGIYSSSFALSTFEPSLNAYLSGSNQIEFKTSWKSLDQTVTFAKNYATFQNKVGLASNVQNTNWVVNITNLRDSYLGNASEPTRLRVFAYDYNTEQVASKLASPSRSAIIRDMRWQIKEAYSKRVVIPFDVCTKLSYDGNGMYFDLYTSDLDPSQIYQIDFLVKSHKDTYIENAGFRFKVVST